MAPAANLLEAATKTPSNLLPLWEASTLQAKVIAFWQAIDPEFPDEVDSNQPVSNWIAIIAAFAPSILDYEQPAPNSGVGLNTQATFQTTVDYIYRLCKFAYYYAAQGLISATQAAAILTAYNAQFA